MTDAVVISTTTANRPDAERLADALLDGRLAACVQLLDIASRYVWQGERAAAAEVLLLIKTRAELYPAVEAEILRIHPYEVPEILVTPVMAGHRPYLDWIAAETRGPPSDG